MTGVYKAKTEDRGPKPLENEDPENYDPPRKRIPLKLGGLRFRGLPILGGLRFLDAH